MRAAATLAAIFCLYGCGSSDAADAGWQGTPYDGSFADAGPIDLTDAYPTADPDPDAHSPSPSFVGDGGATITCTGKTITGDHDENVISGGLPRTAHLHVPSSYDPNSGAMLVLAFHGFFETDLEQEVQSRMDESADAKNFIVAYPQGIANSWNAGECCGDAWTNNVDDVQFTRDLLGAIEADFCIDPKRVFATGFSNGGFFSHRLGCEMSDVFGAIAPVSGVLGVPPDTCKPTRPIPVLDFHGVDDPIVPYNGGTPLVEIDLAGILNFTSVPDTISFWVNTNGCLAPPITIFQNGDATCTQYGLCKGGADVVHCKISDGGHQWPGGVAIPLLGTCSTDISATDTIIDFFMANPLP